jgi:broad specificity phosphatase PhoE
VTIRLTLICHASTSRLRAGAFPDDEPLDERGRVRATAAGAALRAAGRALVSPALRARQTAEAMGLAADVDPLLRDCDYGRWNGRTLADVEKEEPSAVAAWIAKLGSAPHGGESIEALLRRVATWLDERGRENGRQVAVTHPTVIRAAVVQAIGANSSSFWRIDVAPLTLTDLRGHHGRWTLRATGLLI